MRVNTLRLIMAIFYFVGAIAVIQIAWSLVVTTAVVILTAGLIYLVIEIGVVQRIALGSQQLTVDAFNALLKRLESSKVHDISKLYENPYYRKVAEKCPECGSDNIESTTMGWDESKGEKDPNLKTCMNCEHKWGMMLEN